MRYAKGDVVVDMARNLAGQVMEVNGNALTLARSEGRGMWEQEVDQCRPASHVEAASLTPGGAIRVISSSRWRP
ncbi:hypothetical protein ACFYN0_06825 [Streptomyces sp. NPDC006704]|uniref:hypothetical protein n=1 Tax=Streptomyces sp. NPDC006704 TaxID=3364760 RepID=UPI0036932255